MTIKRGPQTLFLIIASLASLVSVAEGAWYVDVAVAASGTGTTWSSAWKRLADINWSQVAPGDTIYISGGQYNEPLMLTTRNGMPGQPVTTSRVSFAITCGPR